MNPKKIPPNVWRKCLHESDWNFSLCQNDEWERCLSWELHREKAQNENGGVFPDVFAYKVTGSTPRFGVKFGSQKVKKIKVEGAWLSYIEKRQSELWKLIQPDEPDQSIWISSDWHNVRRYYGEEIDEAAKILPTPSVMDGDSTTQLIPLKIPWHWRDDEISSAFRQWLKANRPSGESWDDRPATPEPPKLTSKAGRGSKIGQAKAKLKALAAWRLLQHHKGHTGLAFSHTGAEAYLGTTFEHDSEWTSARKAVEAALNNYRPGI